jgi:hypothetical protein
MLYTIDMTPWTEDQPVARPLPTHRTTQKQNKCRPTSTPLVGFEPTIPVFKRAKTVNALDHKTTVIIRKIISYEKKGLDGNVEMDWTKPAQWRIERRLKQCLSLVFEYQEGMLIYERSDSCFGDKTLTIRRAMFR